MAAPLVEHDSAASVNEDAALGMPAHGTREHAGLDFLTDGHELFGRADMLALCGSTPECFECPFDVVRAQCRGHLRTDTGLPLGHDGI